MDRRYRVGVDIGGTFTDLVLIDDATGERVIGKLRAMHIMGSRFWDTIGFGYERNGTGEGHW